MSSEAAPLEAEAAAARRRGEPRERMNEDHTLEEESPTQLGYTLLYYTFALVMFILLVTDSLQNGHWTSSVGQEA